MAGAFNVNIVFHCNVAVFGVGAGYDFDHIRRSGGVVVSVVGLAFPVVGRPRCTGDFGDLQIPVVDVTVVVVADDGVAVDADRD